MIFKNHSVTEISLLLYSFSVYIPIFSNSSFYKNLFEVLPGETTEEQTKGKERRSNRKVSLASLFAPIFVIDLPYPYKCTKNR